MATKAQWIDRTFAEMARANDAEAALAVLVAPRITPEMREVIRLLVAEVLASRKR